MFDSTSSAKGPSFGTNRSQEGNVSTSQQLSVEGDQYFTSSQGDSSPLAVTSNPPLRIMGSGRQRRVKGRRSSSHKGGGRSSRPRTVTAVESSEVKGILLVFLVVTMFVALEVLFVDKLLLSPNGRIANMELHVNTANVFVSNIVEASLNRYRLHPGLEIQRLQQEKEQQEQKQQQQQQHDQDEGAAGTMSRGEAIN